MEAAPLTMAHAHASKAIHQLSLRNYKLASEEHQEAAEDFGKAVEDTQDPEALRTLMLLQAHHSLLSSKIMQASLQTPPTPPPSQGSIPGRPHSPDSKVPASMLSPPESPGHRPAPLGDHLRPGPAVDMMLQPPTPTTPSQSSNPTHPTGTAKIAPPPEPLPSPPLSVQTLTLPSRGPVLPAPNPASLATELANARGIRSPVRGRSPADTNKGFLQVQEPEPGARRNSGGTFRSTSPVTLNAVPKKKRNSSSNGMSPVVGPRDKLALAGSLNTPITEVEESQRGRLGSRPQLGPIKSGNSPVRPSAIEFDNTRARSVSPQPPSTESTPDPFNRFYAQLETLINTVSNPLAFAGLPLTNDHTADVDPDLKRALAERPPAESFYVVPPTGGTFSYADMVQRTNDSSLTKLTADPTNDVSPPSSSKPISTKTREELELENLQLRAVTDSLARQLHVLESNAKQNANRMRESLRVFKENNTIPSTATTTKPEPLPSSNNGSIGRQSRFGGIKVRDLPFRTDSSSPEVVKPKDKELPVPSNIGPSNNNNNNNNNSEALLDELSKLKIVHEKTVKENEKLRNVVAKYRERWEKLKEGARSRRAGSPDGNASTTTITTNTTNTSAAPTGDVLEGGTTNKN